jgi:hypothetical protein
MTRASESTLLRCKVGDIVVCSIPDTRNDYKLAQVVTRSNASLEAEYDEPCWLIKAVGTPFWIEEEQGGRHKSPYGNLPDSSLIPLRDVDGEDETLQWASVPKPKPKPKPKRKRKTKGAGQ